MLNQTSEHAIRALVFLAQRRVSEAVPAARIANALGAPANYMAKTLNALARLGLVASTRGPAGGFRLRRPAGRITLAELHDAFRELPAAAVCLMGDRPCDARTPCRAHAKWAWVCAAARAPLGATTIADLLAPESPEIDAGAHAGIHGPVANAA